MVISNQVEPLLIYFEPLEDPNFFRGVAQRNRRAREREVATARVRSEDAVVLIATLVARSK